VFLTEGYENTTIRRIAARAGVTSAALYLYFADKDAILVEICDEAFAKLLQRFDAIGREEGASLAALRRVMEAYLRFGIEHPGEYRLTFFAKAEVTRYSHRAGEVDPQAPGSKGPQTFAMLQRLIAALIDQGVLRPGDPALAAELVWAAGHGLVSLLINFPQFDWSDREVLIEAMVDLPLRGLLADAVR
jgi:AcrR family transcriptional regulator